MVHPQRVIAAQHIQPEGERVVLRGPYFGVLDRKKGFFKSSHICLSGSVILSSLDWSATSCFG